MKEIIWGNITLHYKLDSVNVDEYGCHRFTHFYFGVETITRRKFWFFGKKITIAKPKKVFTLDIDIEDPRYTKEYIRHCIRRKMIYLKRGEQINRGEII